MKYQTKVPEDTLREVLASKKLQFSHPNYLHILTFFQKTNHLLLSSTNAKEYTYAS